MPTPAELLTSCIIEQNRTSTEILGELRVHTSLLKEIREDLFEEEVDDESEGEGGTDPFEALEKLNKMRGSMKGTQKSTKKKKR